MDFQPYVNTECPCFHIYTEEYLSLGRTLLNNKFSTEYVDEWLDAAWERNIDKWLRPVKKKSGLNSIVKSIKNAYRS